MMTPFQKEITQGLPEQLPIKRSVPGDVNRAPKRKDILTAKEKKLALENALRYFPVEWHEVLATEFLEELKTFGRVPIQAFVRDEGSSYFRLSCANTPSSGHHVDDSEQSGSSSSTAP